MMTIIVKVINDNIMKPPIPPSSASSKTSFDDVPGSVFS